MPAFCPKHRASSISVRHWIVAVMVIPPRVVNGATQHPFRWQKICRRQSTLPCPNSGGCVSSLPAGALDSLRPLGFFRIKRNTTPASFPSRRQYAEHAPDRFPIAGRFHSSERGEEKICRSGFQDRLQQEKTDRIGHSQDLKMQADFSGANPRLRALQPSSPGQSGATQG